MVIFPNFLAWYKKWEKGNEKNFIWHAYLLCENLLSTTIVRLRNRKLYDGIGRYPVPVGVMLFGIGPVQTCERWLSY